VSDTYTATGSQDTTTGTPGDTSLAIIASTSKRGYVYDMMLSTGGTPADNAIQWLARRMTAVGTEGAGVTPIQLNGGPAALLDGAENHSAEPTYTAASEMFDQIINQRAFTRWVAPPGGEWVIPATASNGIGFTAFHASYTGSAECTASWRE
jgi:hypothetical protein